MSIKSIKRNWITIFQWNIINSSKTRKPSSPPIGTITSFTRNIDFQAYIFTKIGLFVLGIVFAGLTIFRTQFIDSEDPFLLDLAEKSGIAIELALIGIVFFLLDVVLIIGAQEETIKFKVRNITREDVSVIISAVILGTFVIAFSNFLIFQTFHIPRFSITGIDLFVAFAIMMGIVEELFFTFFGQIFIVLLLTKTRIRPFARVFGLLVRAGGFTYYHFNVYGQQPEFLLSVFIMGLTLGIVLEITRRIESNMLIHAFVNLLAGSLGSGFTISA